MIRSVLTTLCIGLLAVGCASTGGSGTPEARTQTQNVSFRTNLQGQGFQLRMTEDIVVRIDTVDVAADRLWPEVPAAYDALGIPITTVNAEARVIGALQARVRGRIGDAPVSRFVRCGSTMTGEVADQYEVHLTSITQVEPAAADSGRSILSSHVTAVAQGTASGNTVQCATRGRLEGNIREQLLIELGRGDG